MPAPKRYGFTITELIVVIAVIAILFTIMLPALHQSRESVRAAMCASNLHQLNVGAHNVRADAAIAGQSPASVVQPEGWVSAVLPGVNNLPIAFRCPNDATEAGSSASGETGATGIQRVDVLEEAPPSLEFNQFQSPDRAVLVPERKGYILPSTVAIDTPAPGGVNSVAAGEEVDVWLLHIDMPKGYGGGYLDTEVSFSNDVLGVIWDDTPLDNTDATLGAVGTAYPKGHPRGLEANLGHDSLAIADDARSIQFSLLFGGAADSARIITRPGGAAYSSYGMNDQVRGIAPSSAVVLTDYGSTIIDMDDRDGEVDDQDRLRLRHHNRANVLYGDGSVRLDGPAEFFTPSADHWDAGG